MHANPLLRVCGAFLTAVVMAIGFNVAMSAATCSTECTCGTLFCGGSGCSCEAWDDAWFACGGGPGCDYDCGEGEVRVCCNEVCEGEAP
jgi:hypothetical protein